MRSLIKKILVYFNYILAVFILLADLSVLISPGDIWPAAFLGLAFPFLLFLNLLFFIYWASVKRKELLISLIALIISAPNVHKTFQFPDIFEDNKKTAKSESSSKSLKVLTYNIQIFNLLGRTHFGEHQQQLFHFIQSENPDIICFQEFYTNVDKGLSLSKINSLLENYPYRHIEWIVEGDASKYGIAIYSKYRLVNKSRLSFKNTNNSTIFADVLWGTDTVRLFNNHLQSIKFDRQNYKFITNQGDYSQTQKIKELQDISFRLRDAFIKRAEQADHLSRKIQNSSYPVIVCGDFNDTPISYTYRKIRGNLNDSFLEAGRGLGSTYEGKFPSYRIDFILHSSSLETFFYETKRVKLSDHYPVVAEIRLVE